MNENTQQRVDIFKKTLKDMIAVSKAAYIKSDAKENRTKVVRYRREDILRIVANGSAIERAELSHHFFVTNGLYKKIILHYAAFLTYSWVVVPQKKNYKDKMTNPKIMNSYYKATDFCSSFQIERKCTLFAKDILVKGGYYGLIHDEVNFVTIQDLPFEFCRSRFKNVQDIDIVEFNVRFFDTIFEEALRKEILSTYPKIIQKGYWNFKRKGTSPWVFIPAELGIYFCFFEERPFFLDIIPLLDDLDDYKDIDKKRNLLGLKRIITQKIKIDGSRLVFEPEEAQIMHEGVLDMLQNNPDIDVITSYNDVNILDLSGKDDDSTDVEEIQDLVYETAGVAKEIFSSSTDAGLEASLKNDLSLMCILGQKFAHFFTALLNNKFGTNKVKFKLNIMPISFYNSDEYTTKARDLASFGYSFLTPILSTGIDQSNLSNLKELELDVLNLDVVLKPLQSAYTQSGKVAAEENNPPQTVSEQIEEKTEEGNSITDDNPSEDNNNGGE